jgi:hypothetical protein
MNVPSREAGAHRLTMLGEFNHLLGLDFSRYEAMLGFRDSYDVLVIPGTTATVAPFASGSLASGVNRPYVVDPRSWLFQLGLRTPNGVLAKHMDLAREHGSELADIIQNGALTPDHIRNNELLSDFVNGMLDFQKSLRNARDRKRLARVALRLAAMGEEMPRTLEQPTPFVLVPPYFSCSTSIPGTANDESSWFEANVAMAEMAAQRKGDMRVCPVVAVSRRMLTQERDRVINAYSHSGYDGYFVLVDSLKENSARELELFGLRELVRELSTRYSLPVMNLAGGYFSLLLYRFGMTGVCHAPGYGENRTITGRGAGGSKDGGARARYYVPGLHRFLTPILATLLLNTLGQDFWCTCADCAPARFTEEFEAVQMEDKRLISHFMTIRNAEIQHVLTTGLPDLVAELEETYERSIVHIRGPLDPLTGSVSHLVKWARVLQS